ncbi:MAG: hypothetical protein ABGY11_09700, partial [Candidatus Thioglobus sp.]
MASTLLAIDLDGLLIGRVRRDRLNQHLQSFVTLFDNPLLLTEAEQRHDAIVRFFKRYMDQVFLTSTEGMCKISEAFLIDLSDKLADEFQSAKESEEEFDIDAFLGVGERKPIK